MLSITRMFFIAGVFIDFIPEDIGEYKIKKISRDIAYLIQSSFKKLSTFHLIEASWTH